MTVIKKSAAIANEMPTVADHWTGLEGLVAEFANIWTEAPTETWATVKIDVLLCLMSLSVTTHNSRPG